jgi:hypothetical protein
MRKPLVKEPVQDDQKIVKWFLGKHCEDLNVFRSMSNSKHVGHSSVSIIQEFSI